MHFIFLYRLGRMRVKHNFTQVTKSVYSFLSKKSFVLLCRPLLNWPWTGIIVLLHFSCCVCFARSVSGDLHAQLWSTHSSFRSSCVLLSIFLLLCQYICLFSSSAWNQRFMNLFIYFVLSLSCITVSFKNL